MLFYRKGKMGMVNPMKGAIAVNHKKMKTIKISGINYNKTHIAQ